MRPFDWHFDGVRMAYKALVRDAISSCTAWFYPERQLLQVSVGLHVVVGVRDLADASAELRLRDFRPGR